MENVTIEKGIPLPPQKWGVSLARWPWQQMEVGDSFLFPATLTAHQAYRAAKRATTHYAPKKFSARINKARRLRVWRTA